MDLESLQGWGHFQGWGYSPSLDLCWSRELRSGVPRGPDPSWDSVLGNNPRNPQTGRKSRSSLSSFTLTFPLEQILLSSESGAGKINTLNTLYLFLYTSITINKFPISGKNWKNGTETTGCGTVKSISKLKLVGILWKQIHGIFFFEQNPISAWFKKSALGGFFSKPSFPLSRRIAGNHRLDVGSINSVLIQHKYLGKKPKTGAWECSLQGKALPGQRAGRSWKNREIEALLQFSQLYFPWVSWILLLPSALLLRHSLQFCSSRNGRKIEPPTWQVDHSQ